MMDEQKDSFEKEDMNQMIFNNLITRISMYTDIFLGVAHLFYFIFFVILQLYIVAFINLGVLLLYFSYYFLIKKKKINLFIHLTYITYVASASAATVLMGFQTGIHICLYGMCILLFFVSYFSKKVDNKVKPFPLCIIIILDYIALYFVCSYVDPIYPLSFTARSILFILHISVSIILSMVFLSFFVKYVLSLEKKIKKESQIDKLTNLGNRKALAEYFNEMDKKERYSLAMLDIDDFKKVNDRYGHLVGDYILRKTSEIISSVYKNADVFRYGGEEFIIISKITESYEENCNMLDKVRQTVADYEYNIDYLKLRITITFGVAEYDSSSNLEDWIKLADDRLYYGKKHGKNQVVAK